VDFSPQWSSQNAAHDGTLSEVVETSASMSLSDEPVTGSTLGFGPVASAAPAASEPTRSSGKRARRKQVQSEMRGVLRRRRQTAEPVQLGTGYGKETTMHTETTTFERATPAPVLRISVQYAVREQLVRWGVPVYEEPPQPEAFPASPSVAPPPGWQARR
jgi:hypothetical protein